MLEAAILEAPPVLLSAEDAHCMLEASVGAAEYASAAELDTVIRHADRVMYAQKQRRKRASGSYAITAAS
jgi:GGDEF domain-containing protein